MKRSSKVQKDLFTSWSVMSDQWSAVNYLYWVYSYRLTLLLKFLLLPLLNDRIPHGWNYRFHPTSQSKIMSRQLLLQQYTILKIFHSANVPGRQRESLPPVEVTERINCFLIITSASLYFFISVMRIISKARCFVLLRNKSLNSCWIMIKNLKWINQLIAGKVFCL